MFWRIYRFKIRLNNWNGKHFPCFHTVIETRLGEREIEVGTRAGRVSVSTQFRVLSNFHECNITVWEHGGNVFYFFYKITRRKLKRGNSLLYQSVNSPYRSRWRIMAWTFPCFPYSYRNTAFNQSKLTFSKCYFIITDTATQLSIYMLFYLLF